MHCFRDAPSLHQFLYSCPSPELSQLIGAHLNALAVFDEMPLGELAQFFIVDRVDSADAVALLWVETSRISAPVLAGTRVFEERSVRKVPNQPCQGREGKTATAPEDRGEDRP